MELQRKVLGWQSFEQGWSKSDARPAAGCGECDMVLLYVSLCWEMCILDSF